MQRSFNPIDFKDEIVPILCIFNSLAKVNVFIEKDLQWFPHLIPIQNLPTNLIEFGDPIASLISHMLTGGLNT